eukprot:TRINITY_DN103623_c0_g1_i1.p1 TRINITY_DN103623_c0_g1~~TRINITY_DN103623_c0_g1_i1.p1  ORF type:complete len:605 (+),score=80.35 TRINITY_DN103623_c0_g1_i1:34-1815(+)
MPTLSALRDNLLKLLERESITDEQFEDICFDFGVELDDVTSEYEIKRREQGEEAAKGACKDVIYKIDLPANRYDLVCVEGFATALRVYLGLMGVPKFRCLPPQLTMKVSNSVKNVREFCVCAVLRNLSFNTASYNSFIDLQDKLHQNLARKRTLVSVGTHDLDSISSKGPFRYDAIPRKEIKFIPLTKTEPVTGENFIEEYKKEKHLAKYLHIIENFPNFPLIRDCEDTVLSLPPIINGDKSKITTDTKNVFIEVTATDEHKANIVLNLIVAAFSTYCKEQFTVEAVNVEYEDGRKVVTPDVAPREMNCSIDYINKSIGVELSADQVVEFLAKMMLTATKIDDNNVKVEIPCNRPDVLHPCDIMEDAAIAYGYDNIHKECKPVPTVSIGSQQPVWKLTHQMRTELATAGYNEVLTFSLCSQADAYTRLNKGEPPAKGSAEDVAVHIGNPQTPEFEICRISLLPGLLKTLNCSSSCPLPIKLFEVSDIVLKDTSRDVGCRNQRNVAALYCGTTSGLEEIQGLVDFSMKKLGVKAGDYTVEPSTDPTFFPKRQATILYKGVPIGAFGIIHPKVLGAFDIKFPTSYMEFNLHPFFE